MLGFLARVGRPSVWDKPGLGWPCSGNQEDCSFLVTTGVVHQPLACFFSLPFIVTCIYLHMGGMWHIVRARGIKLDSTHPSSLSQLNSPFSSFSFALFSWKS